MIPDITADQAADIQAVFQGDADNLDDNTITYVNDPVGDATYAGFYGHNYGGVIYLEQLYFPGTNEEQFGTIIHELTHTVTGDTDYAYFRFLRQDPVSWAEPTDSDINVTVTTAELMSIPILTPVI